MLIFVLLFSFLGIKVLFFVAFCLNLGIVFGEGLIGTFIIFASKILSGIWTIFSMGSEFFFA